MHKQVIRMLLTGASFFLYPKGLPVCICADRTIAPFCFGDAEYCA